MAGDKGEFGQAYMLGVKNDELVFTLKSAEYSVHRMEIGNDAPQMAVPKGDEKLLVLHFSAQNPQKSDMDYFNSAAFLITAVDAKDVNHVATFHGRDGSNEGFGLQLKPAQKIDVYTAIVVPASGPVPKLIVQRGEGTPVLRYDLRGKVKPLTAPFADPSDSSGVTALSEVPAKAAVLYPYQQFDMQFDNSAFYTGSMGEVSLDEGKRFLTATITLKNARINPVEYGGGTIRSWVILASGEKVEGNEGLFRPNRGEGMQGELKRGEKVQARLLFSVPEGDAPKTLYIQEGAESRVYVYDISGTK